MRYIIVFALLGTAACASPEQTTLRQMAMDPSYERTAADPGIPEDEMLTLSQQKRIGTQVWHCYKDSEGRAAYFIDSGKKEGEILPYFLEEQLK